MSRSKIFKALTILVTLLILYGIVSIWASYNYLTVREYEVESSKVSHELRIAVLADLHGHEFGRDNEKLVEKTLEQKPDLILIVGDILNGDAANSEVPCAVVRGLSRQVPVYFSFGNHEEAYMAKRSAGANAESEATLRAELEVAGAVVLDRQYVDLEFHGEQIRLGGMYDYAFGLDGNNTAESAPQEVKEFLEEFQDTERLKIMMAHRPDSFIFGNAAEVWDVDLIVSGHVHGGQVVLPFGNGLYGMDQGWFPKYVHGVYEKGNMQFFVTSGLGSGRQILPRVNNPPEIAVVAIQPEVLREEN